MLKHSSVARALMVLLLLCNMTQAAHPTIPVTINSNIKVQAEVVYTDADRAAGLMFRKTLAPDAGMLFIFLNLDYHSFWMKNTLIPLDMIWLNEDKEIVYYLTATPCKKDPCESYAPMQKGFYVLEVNAGFAKKHNLKIGDKLEFTLPENIIAE